MGFLDDLKKLTRPYDDEDEFLDVVRIPLSELVDQVLAGKITDGKTQVAILQTNEILRRRQENAERRTSNGQNVT